MVKIANFRLAVEAANQGRWFEYLPPGFVPSKEEPAPRVKLARTYGADWDACIDQQRIELGLPDDDEGTEEQRAEFSLVALARVAVKDWEGFEDEGGQPIPFSPEAALEMFRDEGYQPFYRFCLISASTVANYTEAAIARAAGN